MTWPDMDQLCRHCGIRRGLYRMLDDKCPADGVKDDWVQGETTREFMRQAGECYEVRSTCFEPGDWPGEDD